MEFTKIDAEIDAEFADIKIKMETLGQKFKNPIEIGSSFNEYYNYRLYLTDIKKKHKRTINSYNKERKVLFNDVIKSVKTGIRQGSFTGNIDIVPKNDLERTVIYENALSDIDYEIEVVNCHLNFILDQLLLIDKMIFGFDTLLQYKKQWAS